MSEYTFLLWCPGAGSRTGFVGTPIGLFDFVLCAAAELYGATRYAWLPCRLSCRRTPTDADPAVTRDVGGDLPPVVGGDLSALAAFADEHAAAWLAEAATHVRPAGTPDDAVPF